MTAPLYFKNSDGSATRRDMLWLATVGMGGVFHGQWFRFEKRLGTFILY